MDFRVLGSTVAETMGACMKTFGSVEELLDFAIEKEAEAATFYANLARRMESTGMQAVFEQFSTEEFKHKQKLEDVKAGKRFLRVSEKVADLRIAESLMEVPLSAEMNYQEALIVAMKREKVAFKLYEDLAAIAPDEATRSVLLDLAQEEARHKLGIELEYDRRILTDN